MAASATTSCPAITPYFGHPLFSLLGSSLPFKLCWLLVDMSARPSNTHGVAVLIMHTHMRIQSIC